MVIVLVLLPVLVAACGDDSDTAGTDTSSTSSTTKAPARRGADGTLALGQLAPITGKLSSIAKSMTVPVQAAVDEINLSGGVNGKPVTIAVADDGGGDNPDLASASFKELIDTKKVDALIGPAATGTALDLLSSIRTNRVLTCSGSNSAEELSVADSGGYYFRTLAPDRVQAIALGRLLAAEGKTQPVIVARKDAYGEAFVVPLERELRRAGITPLGKPIRYNPATKNLTWVGKEVADRHPDSVVTIALTDEDGAPLIQSLSAAGVGPNQLPVYAPDGLQNMDFHTAVNPTNPAAVYGIRGTAAAAAPAGPENAVTGALRKAGVPPVFSAHYYDCTILTALAALQAGTDDPSKMKDAFAKSLRGKTDCTTFAACKQALDAGDTIHYRGTSSPFDVWERIEPGQGTYDRWTYDGTGNVVTDPPSAQIRVP